jgi:hypothetical protein
VVMPSVIMNNQDFTNGQVFRDVNRAGGRAGIVESDAIAK